MKPLLIKISAFAILLLAGLSMTTIDASLSPESSEIYTSQGDVAKSLDSDIAWSNGQSHVKEITDLSDFTVVEGKIYKLTFYGVFKNKTTKAQRLKAEWVLSDGANGSFAGLAIGQHSPTNFLGEIWTINDDVAYRGIEIDGTLDIASKHSIEMNTSFTCTSSGKLDLHFGGVLGFATTLYSGSAVFVEEF